MARLDDAVKRVEAALSLLEASLGRRFEAERRRADLETELQIMQDDRARLALELEGSQGRLGRMEAATEDVDRRVHRAIGSIQDILGRLGPSDARGDA